MWCVSDREPLENIFGYDDKKMNETLKFSSALTGKPIPPPPAADDYLRNPGAEPKRSSGGEFEFRFSKPKAAHIAMSESRNIAVRELYNNPAEPTGGKKTNFEFDFLDYNNRPCYIRFLADNRILMEQEMSFRFIPSPDIFCRIQRVRKEAGKPKRPRPLYRFSICG